MANVLRRLVSGDKERLRDRALKLELDLVYLTNQVIIMGYPAVGVESLYRNRRLDVVRYLKHHHGQHFWVYNLCPTAEYSYSDSVFDGRISRYPFPDHHVPPFAMLKLAVREMHAWISSAPERVAVLHCKAGKGRSGTISCAYLLYQGYNSASVQLEATPSAEQRSSIPTNLTVQDTPEQTDPPLRDDTFALNAKCSEALQKVLDLHTSRRMKPPSSVRRIKAGVSIPSQRRWLYYWLLSLDDPDSASNQFITVRDSVGAISGTVRITQVKLRTTPMTGIRRVLATVANNSRQLLGMSSPSSHGKESHVWMSLAHYDDEFVDLLYDCEKQTGGRVRDVGSAMKRIVHNSFDTEKMIKKFMRIGFFKQTSTPSIPGQRFQDFALYHPKSDEWVNISHGDTINRRNASYSGASTFHQNSSIDNQGGILLNARREVRLKIFKEGISLGWVWLIPSFHMGNQMSQTNRCVKVHFGRDEIDFPPLGNSAGIVDLEVSLEWS